MEYATQTESVTAEIMMKIPSRSEQIARIQISYSWNFLVVMKPAKSALMAPKRVRAASTAPL